MQLGCHRSGNDQIPHGLHGEKEGSRKKGIQQVMVLQGLQVYKVKGEENTLHFDTLKLQA